MSGVNVNTKTISLPTEVASKIISKVQEDSAVMAMAQYMDLPGLGATIPVITSDPEAEWVSETGLKKVSRPGLATKVMQAYTLAVIVPFSNQFKNNVPALYNAIVERLPKALAQKFDSTVFHGTAPGSNFDTFASCTAQAFGSDPYAALVAADADIAAHNGITDGFVIAPQGKSKLLSATDSTGRPLFINSVAEGAIPMILGSKTMQSKAAYKNDTTDILGVAGDWTQAIYGIAQNLTLSISDQATLVDGEQTINLWQQNMFAVRAEIEVGFVADTACFNLLSE
ncbi:MAG: phage major capsid protein [Bacteroidales bacterium]|nr:phage major capsid protein [Candidatus Scybalousia scybalohippi]